MNHKQANEKFFRVQTARRMKNSHSPFLFFKIKKERVNLKKMDETEVYRYSLSFAAGSREKDLWVNSYRANLACAEFIQKKIAEDFDGMHLSDSCLQTILDAYGFDRVM